MSKFCPKCWSKINNEEIKFCPKCWSNFKVENENKKIKFNKVYTYLFIFLLVIFFLTKEWFDIYYWVILNQEKKNYERIISQIDSEVTKKWYDLNNTIKFVFRINKDFSQVKWNDLYNDTNDILTKLVYLNEKKDIKRNWFLEKLIFILNKEKEWYLIKSDKKEVNSWSILNVIEKPNLFEWFQCRDFSKSSIENKTIIDNNWIWNKTHKIINNSWSLNSSYINDWCFEYLNNEFILLNNSYLIRDEIIKNKKNNNLYLALINTNYWYINYVLFDWNKKIFSTLDDWTKPFKEITIPYSYEEESIECSRYETTENLFYPEKICVERKKVKQNINVKLKFKNWKLVSDFFSSNPIESRSILIYLYNISISIDKNSNKVYYIFPSNIHKTYADVKKFLNISIKDSSYDENKIEINNVSIK